MQALTQETSGPPGMTLAGIGDLTVYYAKGCWQSIKDNVKIVLEKLALPQFNMQFDVSDSLKNAADGGLGGLASFAGDYLKRNADKIAMGLLSTLSPKLKNAILDTVNNIYKTLAFAFQANNNLVYIMMKIVARNCISQIDRKDKILTEIQTKLTALYNRVVLFAAGDPVLNRYLETLKTAMSEVLLASVSVKQTYSTMSKTNVFLTKAWKDAHTHIYKAQVILQPATGANPYTSPFLQATTANVGEITAPTATHSSPNKHIPASFLSGALLIEGESSGYIPTTAEQTDNLLAIPQLTSEIIKSMKDYSALTLSINGMLRTIIAGVDLLCTALFDQVRQSLLDQMGSIDKDITDLYKEMARFITPQDQSKPSPIKLTAQSLKWSISLHFIKNSMEMFPVKSLEASAKSLNEAKIYQSFVDSLKKLDTVSSGKAVLTATDAQEDLGGFERQMLTALLQANGVLLNHDLAKTTSPLIKTLLARTDLGIKRDADIKAVLNSFIHYQFEGEAALAKILGAAQNIMKAAGLDRAADLFLTGDWASFFNLTGKNAIYATYIGAGLGAIALLKDCFKNSEEDQKKFKPYQRKLEGEMDLVNIKVSFDLDLAFLKNLKICSDAENLMKLFNFQELFCTLARASGVGSLFAKLDELTSMADLRPPQVSDYL